MTEIDPQRMKGKEKALSRQTFVMETIKIVKLSDLYPEKKKARRRRKRNNPDRSSDITEDRHHATEITPRAIPPLIPTAGVASDMIEPTASGSTGSGEPTGPNDETLNILDVNHRAGISSEAALEGAQLDRLSTPTKRKKDANSPTSSAVVAAGGKSPKRRLTSSGTACDKEIPSNGYNEVLMMELGPPLQESSTKRIVPEATDDDSPQASFEHVRNLSTASFQSLDQAPLPMTSRGTSSRLEQVGQAQAVSLSRNQQLPPTPYALGMPTTLNVTHPSHQPAIELIPVQNLPPGDVISPPSSSLQMEYPPNEMSNISYRPEDRLRSLHTIFLIRDILHFMTSNTGRTQQVENGVTATDIEPPRSAPPPTTTSSSTRSEHPSTEQREASPSGPANNSGDKAAHINRIMSVDERLDILAHASVSLAKHLFPYRGLDLEQRITDLNQKLLRQTEQLGGIGGFGDGGDGWLPVSATAMHEAHVARERATNPTPTMPTLNLVNSILRTIEARAVQPETLDDNEDVNMEDINDDEDHLNDVPDLLQGHAATTPPASLDLSSETNATEKRKWKGKERAGNADLPTSLPPNEVTELRQLIQEERKHHEDELSLLRDSLQQVKEELRKYKEEKAAHPPFGSTTEVEIQNMKARMQALEEKAAAAARNPASSLRGSSPTSGSARSHGTLYGPRSGQHTVVSSYHPLSHLMLAGSGSDVKRPPSSTPESASLADLSATARSPKPDSLPVISGARPLPSDTTAVIHEPSISIMAGKWGRKTKSALSGPDAEGSSPNTSSRM
ncbi:hypothetical protein D9613_002410 [Agrocybe pediades]|uniref:Uncharacterized protein n=1 Tax=Agrocybe pediades TaxID=84607 RepID=A0A8H4R6R9_9AGAR|nr:hypothetical protein D9613_002410 [Agrocybe pediades]